MTSDRNNRLGRPCAMASLIIVLSVAAVAAPGYAGAPRQGLLTAAGVLSSTCGTDAQIDHRLNGLPLARGGRCDQASATPLVMLEQVVGSGTPFIVHGDDATDLVLVEAGPGGAAEGRRILARMSLTAPPVLFDLRSASVSALRRLERDESLLTVIVSATSCPIHVDWAAGRVTPIGPGSNPPAPACVSAASMISRIPVGGGR